MAKQRMVNTRFWSDPWVVDELNPLDRYLFLYLLTNEKTNITGVYELSIRTMSNETGIEKEELLRMLKRLESRVVYTSGWLVFRKSVKHQNFRSPKIESAIARELREIPEDVMQYMDIPSDLSKTLSEEYGIHTVSIRYGSGIAPNLTKPNLTKVTKPNVDAPVKPTALKKISTEEINQLLTYWETTTGMNVDSLANRKACAAMLRLPKMNQEKLKQLIAGVALSQNDQYAPRISDFVSLKRKMNDLILWGKKHNQAVSVEVIS